jgi:hypothetical protein
MVGTIPILLALAAVVFAGERLHFGGWLAFAGSTLGATLIALSSKTVSGVAQASTRGDLLVVLSMFAGIGWILISKRLMQRNSPLMVTGSVFWLGTVLPAAVVIPTNGVPSLHRLPSRDDGFNIEAVLDEGHETRDLEQPEGIQKRAWGTSTAISQKRTSGPECSRIAMIPNSFCRIDLRTQRLPNSIHSLHESALR